MEREVELVVLEIKVKYTKKNEVSFRLRRKLLIRNMFKIQTLFSVFMGVF